MPSRNPLQSRPNTTPSYSRRIVTQVGLASHCQRRLDLDRFPLRRGSLLPGRFLPPMQVSWRPQGIGVLDRGGGRPIAKKGGPRLKTRYALQSHVGGSHFEPRLLVTEPFVSMRPSRDFSVNLQSRSQGTTPSTVKAVFMCTVFSAGYHIELAGGGRRNPVALRSKVAETQANIPTGVGAALNSLYVNPRRSTFQLPLWQEMRREGLPIEDFCVAAGIPTVEKAAEIIEGLTKLGIKRVSFRPGSVDGVCRAVNIATSDPHFSSGHVDARAVAAHAKTFASPSSPLFLSSANTSTSCLLLALVSAALKTFGRT